MSITYYVVVPFGRDEAGNLMPLEPAEAPNSEAARSRARIAAAKHGGAIAFSRTGEPDTGEFGEAVILGTFGEVDQGMLAE